MSPDPKFGTKGMIIVAKIALIKEMRALPARTLEGGRAKVQVVS